MRIAIGGFVQESNSFSPVPGAWMHFPPEQILRDTELFAQRIGTRTEIGGALDTAQRYRFEPLPLMMGSACASAGHLTSELFTTLRDELIDRIRAIGPLDGLLLVLHGAMAAEGFEDATGEVLRAAREVIGPQVPLVATLDLHANVTMQMASEATALVGYRTAPHIDLYETGERGMELLYAIVRGEAHPAVALRRLPMIVPAENGRTTEGPYAEVMNQAIELAGMPGVLDISVFSVQPWLDVEDVGCSVIVTTNGDPTRADELADQLADMLWERREAFAVELVPAAILIQQALASEKGPFVLADSADAPSSGAPGDSTAVLQLLLEAPPRRDCLLNIVDPPAVARMVEAGVGSQITLRLGAFFGSSLYQPIEVTGRVRLISDGDFVHKSPGFQGVTFHRGRTVVFQIGRIFLVVMERPVLQWDAELYRSVGLEPRDAQIVFVKSPAAFRASYAPFAAQIDILDVAGVCSPNLTALPFTHVRRPCYPFDDPVGWR